MWTDDDIYAMRAALLAWYDAEGRTLPWRIRPEDRARGAKPDPYAVWLSEIMLQQTTVPHATPYWRKFLSLYPTVEDLAAAPLDAVLTHWAGLGYYARARNLHKCAGVVAHDYGGVFPTTEKELLTLPGIGAYTAATMAAICFDEATNIVDGNVERVIARLHTVETPLPKAKRELKALAAVLADPHRPGDYGQALMDLGATICSPRSPSCSVCPWETWCVAKAEDRATEFPKKTRKKPRPVRKGKAYIAIAEGCVLLRRRPEDGLLGGMMDVPGTPWTPLGNMGDPPGSGGLVAANQWRLIPSPVIHIFTHFELRLDVYLAEIDKKFPDEGRWVPIVHLTGEALPSLVQKVLDRAGIAWK